MGLASIFGWLNRLIYNLAAEITIFFWCGMLMACLSHDSKYRNCMGKTLNSTAYSNLGPSSMDQADLFWLKKVVML